MGDLNSRTQELLDYIPNESFDYIPLNEDLYNIDSVGTYPRNNMDSGLNSYGPKLLELCKTVPLRILNGRMFGDLFGNLTCYTPQGSSCVDYCAVSPGIFSKVRYFQVQPLLPMFSDHTPITLCLKVNANISVQQSTYIQSADCKEAVRLFFEYWNFTRSEKCRKCNKFYF